MTKQKIFQRFEVIVLMTTFNVFTEHNVELRHLKTLMEDEIKELLPKIGDRQDLKDAIKRKYPNSVDLVRYIA